MIKFYQTIKQLSLVLVLLAMSSMAVGQVFITEIADPNNDAGARYVELFNAGGSSFDLAANNYALLRYTNGNTSPQSAVALTGTIAAGGFYIISPNGTQYNTVYGLTADQDIGTGGPADSNGDDQILLIDNTDNLNPITIDIFGVIGEDGSGTAHEFEDGRAERKSTVTTGVSTWDVNEWNIDNDSGGGDGTQDAPADFDPGSWIGPVTACTPPTTQATSIGFSSVGDNSMIVSWTGGDGDDGVIVLAHEGTAVDADPESGTTYSADANFSGTPDQIGTGNYVVYVGGAAGADNVTITGLTQGTAYHFAVYELNSTDVCYLTPGLTGSQATTSSLDSDSDITDPTTQVTGGSISSLVNDSGSAVDVFTFKLTDAGTSDGVSTDVNTIVVEKGTNNTVADWSSVIAGAILNDGTSDLTVTSTMVNADNITFDLTGNEYAVADGSFEEVTLSVYLNTNVTDEEILEFEIPASPSFDADANGSGFKATLAAAVTSNQFAVDVTATEFDGDSDDVILINRDFVVTISAVDANGNIDKAARTVSASLNSGSGILSSSTGLLSQPMTDGVIVWTDLQYDTEEDFTMKLDDDGSAITITSPTITALGNLFFTDYFEYADASTLNGQGGWNNYSGTDDQMQVGTPGLTYTNYPNSGTGNSAKIVEGGSEDVAAGEVSINSGSLYVSALVNVSGSTTPDTNGEYFMHMNTATGFNYSNRIYVKDDGAGNLNFGITKTSGSVEYLPDALNYDETYLIVFKYTFNTGTSDDDVMDFWVNPTIDGIEPSPDLTHSATLTDASELTRVSLRQSGGTGDVSVDGIRMSTTWEDLLPAPCTPPSSQATSVTFGTTDETSMVVNWTQGDGDNALVVVKEGAAVDTDPESGVAYTANTDLTLGEDLGSGNIVVYAGTSSTQTVTVTGLTQGTTYHVAVYEYNTADNCYNVDSPATGSNDTTTPNDSDSDITANGGESSDIDYTMYQDASSLTTTNSASLFTFSINDKATTDAVSTIVTDISFDITNHENLRTVALFEGANASATTELDVAGTISGSTLTFSGLSLEATTGASLDVTVRATFLDVVDDEEQIQVAITSVTADATGSVFAAADAGAAASDVSTADLNAVEVTATEFAIDAPASAQLNADFAVTATAVDGNGNTDVATRDVTLSLNTGSGTLSSTSGLGSKALANGVYTWSDVQYDVVETITLDVTDGTITSTSGDIEVSTVATYLEDFTNYSETGSSYVDGTFTGNDGSTWTYVQCRGDQTIDAETPMLGKNRTPSAEMTSGTISGGIGTLNFDYMQAFGTNVNLEIYVNDALVGSVTSNGETGVVKNSGDIAVDVAGDFVLSFRNPTDGGQVNIDNVEWISFNSTAPAISIDAGSFGGDFGATTLGTSTASSSFIVSGENLSTDITITAPTGFEVSSDNITFVSSITLTQSGGGVAATMVYAHFNPAAAEFYSNDILLTSSGANDKTIAVSGTGLSAEAVYFEGFDTCPSSTMVTYSVASNEDWDCTTSGNNGNASYISGYGADVASDDWLITPAVDLSSATNATLTFYSWTQYQDAIYPPIELLVSTDYSGTGDPTGATWTELNPIFAPEGVGTTPSDWTGSGDVDLNTYVGGSIYIAFHYTSTGKDGGGDVANWAIDDILIEDRSSIPNPSVTVTASLTDFGSVDNGSVSASQSVTVEGDNLTADISITAPSNFEVSLDDATFTSSVAVTPSSGTVASTSVFVRFAPSSGINGALSGDITISTESANNQTIAVSGTEAGNTVIEDDLFFSEYIEPNGGNEKAFEIYNGTGAAVDLSNYMVKLSHNGLGFSNDGDVYDLPLSGTLADGDVYVIYNADATDATILAEGDLALTYGEANGGSVASYNGNDALGLFKNGVLIDLIGDPTDDVSTGWAVAGVTDGTVNHTLIRKETISTGNIVPLGSFGTNADDSEWEVLDENTFSNLGSHNANPVEPGFAVDDANFNGDFGSVAVGSASVASSYVVSGSEITGDLTITIPAGFEASLTSDFSNQVGNSSLPLSITPASGTIDNVTVFVRFVPSAAGAASGNLVHEATGYTSVNLAVSGEGTEEVTWLEEDLRRNVSIYPNPASSVLSVMVPEGLRGADVSLINLNGGIVKKAVIDSSLNINVSDVRSGVYLLQIVHKQVAISQRVVLK